MMQRAAFIHYCLLADSSRESHAFYCDGRGLKRVGISKATVTRHKDKVHRDVRHDSCKCENQIGWFRFSHSHVS